MPVARLFTLPPLLILLAAVVLSTAYRFAPSCLYAAESAPTPAAPAGISAQQPDTAPSETARPCRILVLNSYDPEYVWTRTIVKGIREGLADFGMKEAALSIEYLDARRFALPALADNLTALLAEKYRGDLSPDVIIAVDNAAYEFMRKEGEALFGSTPVVFCGVSGIPHEELRYAPHVTGIAGNSSVIQKTTDLIHLLQPEAKRVLFLADYTATGRDIAQEVKAEFTRRRYGFESIEFAPDASAEAIAAELAKLPRSTAVVHLYYCRDKTGRTFSLEEGSDFFSRASKAPFFGTLNITLGHGIVGGQLTTGEVIGHKAAELTSRIRDGQKPLDIPPEIWVEMPTRVDYQQMKRYHLPFSALPEQAEIFFRPPGLATFYQGQKSFVWTVGVVILLQGITIALLLRQRRRLLSIRQQLHESRQLYYSLVNDPPVCICRVLPGGKISYVNDYCCQFFQLPREQLTGSNIIDFAPPERKHQLREFLNDLASSPQNPMRKMECEYPMPDGQPRYIRWINRAVFDLQGRLETIQSIGEDITDLKLTYDVLIENERRFRTVADFTCGWESWLSPTGELLYISPFCETVTGYSPKEFRQTPQLFQTIVFPDDRRLFERYWQEIEADVSFAYRLQHKSGRVVWVEYTGRSVRDTGGVSLGRRLSIRDITERRRAEEALRDNEENLRITLQSISDAVISADLSGAVRSMNSAAEILCERVFSDLAGLNLSQALPLHQAASGERVLDLSERVVSGKPIGEEYSHLLLRTPGGTDKPVTVSGAPIRNSASIVVGSVLVLHDISEQIEMERQLRHTQKMDAVGQLAGGVAHDFNNMLGGIMGAAELILAKDPENTSAGRYAEIIVRTAERASRLTEQLLAFSRKGSEYARPVDLHAVIRDAREILESSLDKRILLQTWLDATDFIVKGDPSQLENAIINLCLNARDAMPEGGELTLETANVVFGNDAPTGPDGMLPPGYYIQLTVSDTGCGIPPEVVHKIFDPFFTTKEVGKGTGLGLSAVYGIVRYHHGAITVRSTPGQGTVFQISLPAHESAPEENEAPAASTFTQGEGTILLIDDEAPIRQTAGLLLESCGYVVHTASGGEEGLDLFRQNPTSYDLVILDMVMPDIDGAEVFHIMKSIRPDVRVIVSSGYLRDTRISTLLEEGVCDFLKKPYRLPELASTVAQAIKFGK